MEDIDQLEEQPQITQEEDPYEEKDSEDEEEDVKQGDDENSDEDGNTTQPAAALHALDTSNASTKEKRDLSSRQNRGRRQPNRQQDDTSKPSKQMVYRVKTAGNAEDNSGA